jgi:hypothetical protein
MSNRIDWRREYVLPLLAVCNAAAWLPFFFFLSLMQLGYLNEEEEDRWLVVPSSWAREKCGPRKKECKKGKKKKSATVGYS